MYTWKRLERLYFLLYFIFFKWRAFL